MDHPFGPSFPGGEQHVEGAEAAGSEIGIREGVDRVEGVGADPDVADADETAVEPEDGEPA